MRAPWEAGRLGHSLAALPAVLLACLLVVLGQVGPALAESSESGRAQGGGYWVLTGSNINSRQEGTATLLPDGQVLAAGGGGNPNTAELYDPGTGRWTSTGSMP